MRCCTCFALFLPYMAKPYTTVNVDGKAHKRLKAHCKTEGKVMSQLLTNIINDYIDKRQPAGK